MTKFEVLIQIFLFKMNFSSNFNDIDFRLEGKERGSFMVFFLRGDSKKEAHEKWTLVIGKIL